MQRFFISMLSFLMLAGCAKFPQVGEFTIYPEYLNELSFHNQDGPVEIVAVNNFTIPETVDAGVKDQKLYIFPKAPTPDSEMELAIRLPSQPIQKVTIKLKQATRQVNDESDLISTIDLTGSL